MTETLAIGLIALGAAVYVGRPLSSRRPPVSRDEPADAIDDALGRKNAALAALVDIEAERQAGKLSQEDFEDLRNTYELEALEALRELDVLAASSGDRLDREVAARRSEIACAACGGPRDASGVCTRCGA